MHYSPVALLVYCEVYLHLSQWMKSCIAGPFLYGAIDDTFLWYRLNHDVDLPQVDYQNKKRTLIKSNHDAV